MRAAILLLLIAPAYAADWVRIAAPGMELVTDAGEKTGRHLLARFEQIRGVFRQAGIADSPLPVRIFAFASERELRAYRDASNVHGFYKNGGERDYIALQVDSDAPRVALHEYVHVVLNHSALRLPVWFEEGTAEFYSTLDLTGSRLRIGVPIESHITLLHSTSPRWTAQDLGSITVASPRYDSGPFYAESWALVHMLNLSPAWRDGIAQFVLSLAEEKPPAEAFAQAFGKTLDDAIAALPAYLRSIRPTLLPGMIEPQPDPRVDPLDPTGSALLRADLALHLDRHRLARSLIENLPESPQTAAGLGGIALAEGRPSEAQRDFERAIALGSRDASLYFEYAMLHREAGATRPRVNDLLQKAVDLNPDFADAQFLLGLDDTDRGAYPSAIRRLTEAVRVRPRRSDYWHALGYAQSKSGDRDAALRSARRAVATAANDVQTHMAEALIALAQQETAAPPLKRPAVNTPSSWTNRHGDARVEGTLTRVDCDNPARLHIEVAPDRTITLQVHHPDRVELVNAPSPDLQLPCGAQHLRIAVEYLAAESDVTRIEFQR